MRPLLFRKSLTQELMSTAIGAFLILVGIVIAQRTAYLIDIAAGGKIASEAIKTLLGFNLIRFLPMLLSLTLFMSVLLTLSRWYRDSEMVIWFSSGMSLSQWIRPVVLFALPIIVVIGLLSLFVTPWASMKGEAFKEQLESKDELATITPGVFKESKNAERVFFIESFDELGNVVKNVYVRSIKNGKLTIITANSGHRETLSNGDSYLVMMNGHRYEGVPEKAEFTSTKFERYLIRVESKESKKAHAPPGIKSTKTWDLLQQKGADTKAELQSRLSMPVSAFVLVLMAIPLSFVDPRAGRSANLIMAALIYIIYNNLLSIMQAWVTQGKIPALVGLWPVHVLFVLITFYLFYRRSMQKSIFPELLSSFKRKR